MAFELEHHAEAVSGIYVVIYDQHSTTHCVRGIPVRPFRLPLQRMASHWEADGELAAFAESLALGSNRAAVKLDQASRQREAYPQTAATRSCAVLGYLTEHPEELADAFRRYSKSVVAHSHGGATLFDTGANFDRSAGGCVLGGVVHEIADHLGEPIKVAVNNDRRVRELQSEVLTV